MTLCAIAFPAISRSTGHWVVTEGIEVASGTAELFDDIRAHDRGGDRLTITHGHDIGIDAVALEAPKMGASAPEAGLDFVGDVQQASTSQSPLFLKASSGK